MNTDTSGYENEESIFSIEDIIVPYFNIEINHVNDNKAPAIVTLKKAIVWLLLVTLLAGLFCV